MSEKVIHIWWGVLGGLVLAIIIGALLSYNTTKKKYSMNLKCIQGELYEEIRPNFYVKSHLECFEVRTLAP